MAGLLISLEIPHNTYPDFGQYKLLEATFETKSHFVGSTIIFELRKNHKNDSYVEAFYFNDTTTSDIHPLPIRKCTEKGICTPKMFHEAVIEFVPTDWNKECNNILKNLTSV